MVALLLPRSAQPQTSPPHSPQDELGLTVHGYPVFCGISHGPAAEEGEEGGRRLITDELQVFLYRSRDDGSWRVTYEAEDMVVVSDGSALRLSCRALPRRPRLPPSTPPAVHPSRRPSARRPQLPFDPVYPARPRHQNRCSIKSVQLGEELPVGLTYCKTDGNEWFVDTAISVQAIAFPPLQSSSPAEGEAGVERLCVGGAGEDGSARARRAQRRRMADLEGHIIIPAFDKAKVGCQVQTSTSGGVHVALRPGSSPARSQDPNEK